MTHPSDHPSRPARASRVAPRVANASSRIDRSVRSRIPPFARASHANARRAVPSNARVQRHSTTRMSAPSESKGTSPADFLRAIEGKTVLVKLNSGVDYRGASSGRFAR